MHLGAEIKALPIFKEIQTMTAVVISELENGSLKAEDGTYLYSYMPGESVVWRWRGSYSKTDGSLHHKERGWDSLSEDEYRQIVSQWDALTVDPRIELRG
jgi:hypothetical protein